MSTFEVHPESRRVTPPAAETSASGPQDFLELTRAKGLNEVKELFVERLPTEDLDILKAIHSFHKVSLDDSDARHIAMRVHDETTRNIQNNGLRAATLAAVETINRLEAFPDIAALEPVRDELTALKAFWFIGQLDVHREPGKILDAIEYVKSSPPRSYITYALMQALESLIPEQPVTKPGEPPLVPHDVIYVEDRLVRFISEQAVANPETSDLLKKLTRWLQEEVTNRPLDQIDHLLSFGRDTLAQLMTPEEILRNRQAAESCFISEIYYNTCHLEAPEKEAGRRKAVRALFKADLTGEPATDLMGDVRRQLSRSLERLGRNYFFGEAAGSLDPAEVRRIQWLINEYKFPREEFTVKSLDLLENWIFRREYGSVLGPIGHAWTRLWGKSLPPFELWERQLS